jgi:hypothetical protein
MSSTPLWTSTQFQNWKTDCTKAIANRQAIEVRNLVNPEQEAFCIDICELHQYTCVLEKRTAFCRPPAAN